MVQKKKIEFGDFQTPIELTNKISDFVQAIFPNPDVIIEPTCGLGSFVESCTSLWGGENCTYYGFDVNSNYVEKCKAALGNYSNCHFEVADFFQNDWKGFFQPFKNTRNLVIGNPPWVTNAAIGVLNGNNLPQKTNFQGLRGFSAKTGKANFDIAEWILIKLLESLQNTSSCLAMLCKTSTARKVLKHAWTNQWRVSNSSLHIIDAKMHFDVAVDACLLITFVLKSEKTTTATIYQNLSYDNKIGNFGLLGKELVADIDNYRKYNHVEGLSYYTWRSGVKHDSSQVMELIKKNGEFVNGFDEVVNIEEDYIFPLLKSSDLGNRRLTPRKFVIVTQQHVGDDTTSIKHDAPKTWAYLEKHSGALDNRKSIIYTKRHRFSVFGVGNYSFTPWKVAVSGLYKEISFSAIGNLNGKPIMVDDTCYFIPCESEEEAFFIAGLLNSEACINFIKSLVFFDSKRPVTIDILKRVDIKKLADSLNLTDKVLRYLPYAQQFMSPQQLLVFEKETEYRTIGSTRRRGAALR
jgi:hypothetical protein